MRVEDYGPGRIRPHERTHPGPKEDRLRLTRATRANLSPIFSLYDDPAGAAWSALEPHRRRAVRRGRPTTTAPSTASGASPTRTRSPRCSDALAAAELLIADGHHRYETARVYAEEIGGEGEHRYVLMCLVALAGPGPDRLPHPPPRRATTTPDAQEALADALREHFDIEQIDAATSSRRPTGDGPLPIGYLDAHFKQPFRLTLKDQAIADAALAGMPEPYRRLDTAVLEALLLKGPLGLTEDDISHLQRPRLRAHRRRGASSSCSSGDVRRRVLPARRRPSSRSATSPRPGVNMPPEVDLLLSRRSRPACCSTRCDDG